MVQVVKKLSANLLGDPMDAVREGKRIYLGRIWGIAGGLKGYTSPDGKPGNGLKGTFAALNQAGEELRAPVCYLPNAANAYVEGELMSGATAVTFAFDIYALDASKPAPGKKKSATGYEFECVALQDAETKGHDPLAQMAATLPAPTAGVKALPGPKGKGRSAG